MHSPAVTGAPPKPVLPLPLIPRAAGRYAFARTLSAREIATLASLFVFWVFCNPFYGVDASNLIYAGRALADLDPGGVGRDAMFVHDGQSSFTLFTTLFRALADTIGLSRASMLIAAAAVAVAFLGAIVLASAIATGPARWLIVAFAAALPAQYGGYKLFSYAEVAATPRPFAEALVLCGIAALLCRRYAAAIALMSFAALMHPIMAASGFALLAAWLVVEDRRWLGPMAFVLVAVAIAAAVGTAPFDRLTTIVDPAWTEILKGRNPQLFPSLWLDGWFGRLTVRVATLVIAARFAPPRVRRLFLLAIPIGVGGLAAAYLFGERGGSLIVLQAQTWRMMWLVFALATGALAITTRELWRCGGTSRIALGLLALAWVFADYDGPACLFAIVAVGVVFAIDPQRYAFAARWLDLVFVVLITGALYGLARNELTILAAHGVPNELAAEVRRATATGLDYTPVAFLAAVLAITRRPRFCTPAAISTTAALCAVLVVLVWDQRSVANVGYDSGGGAPGLVRAIADSPGEVLWVGGGRQTWWFLHRPQWLAPIQGAGLVFSRQLALFYKERTARAIQAGLAEPDLMEPLTPHPNAQPSSITAGGLAAFCAAADAPAWIITPLDGATGPPGGLLWRGWTAPIAELQPGVGNGATWLLVSHYAITRCGAGVKARV